MATTTNGIYYPTSSDNIAPLETVFSTLASSVDTAVKKIQSGVSASFVVGTTVGNATSVTVTFPTAFSAVPAVTTGLSMTAVGSAYTLNIYAVSTTGFSAEVTRVNGTSNDGNLYVNWIARL